MNEFNNDKSVNLCSNCGNENNPDFEYCEACGVKLEGKELIISDNMDENNEIKDSSKMKNPTDPASDHKKQKAKKKKNTIDNPKTVNVIGMVKVFYLALGLLLAGMIMLYSAGIFETPRVTSILTDNKSGKTQEQFHSDADMSQLQEIRNLENIIKENPTDHQSLLKLAHLYNDNGFYDKAIEKYSLYLEIHPNEADVVIDMGVCYYQLKDYNNAIATMQKGLLIDPKHQIGHFNLGIVNFSMGNLVIAKQWWQKAVDIDPSSRIAQKAQELINSN